ncbi:MAG TPA: hypothetical protein VML56_08015 [Burkholderiales bacterium]|jgi:type IV secretory pathway TrbD component|nr:hypothetical protein [Burkholderiales bacterium]
MRRASVILGFVVPALCNVGLAIWLVLHLMRSQPYGRDLSFRTFVWFYGVGGLAIVLSCAAAFMLLATEQPLATNVGARRRWVAVALINTCVPSLLILALIFWR